MEHVKRNSSPPPPPPPPPKSSSPSRPRHYEAVNYANNSTAPLLSGNSKTGLASNPLSAYSITDSQQKATSPPDALETVKSMEMALKILNSLPVIPTLSGELEQYRNNVSAIQQAFESALKAKSAEERSKHWKKCEITANVLLYVLDEKRGAPDFPAESNALKQWVLSCILLGKTNQSDLRASPELPVKTREEFIIWCLAVARAASIGTCTIGQDASLEYLCYIRALNAGCAEARLFIVRDHLLGELYRKPPSYKRFLPREAEAQLKLIAAARKERLPKPEGLDEAHYKIIYDLVDLIRCDSKDRENKRDVLADQLISCKGYEIQQLAPMLYLQSAYGTLDTKKAHTHLVRISYERWQEIRVFPSFNLVHQYWVAELGVGSAPKSTDNWQMERLATDMHPAALYSLIEHYQSHDWPLTALSSLLLLARLNLSVIESRIKNIFFDSIEMLKYMKLKIDPDRQWYFLMILDISFNSPLAYKLSGFGPLIGVNRANSYLYSHFGAVETTKAIINQGTINQANQVLSAAYTTCDIYTNEKNKSPPLSNLALPIGCVAKLHPCIKDLEKKFPFVDDPQILVFRHFSDFLTQGKADSKLLDVAMEQDSVATCYRLLSLNHCTETWGYNRLIEKLLEHSKVNVDLLNPWRDDAGLSNFIQQMTDTYTLKHPAAYCQLMYSISKWIEDKVTFTIVYTRIAARKLIQGHVSDAKYIYQKAKELMPSDLKMPLEKLDDRQRILRSSMPEYYLDIYELGFNCINSCNLIYDFYTLIRTGNYLLKNNNDPAAHHAWCYRITPFFLMKYISFTCELEDVSSIIVACEQQKKISFQISRLNQEMMIAIAERVEGFLEHLPDDFSQTSVWKQLNETIAEIRSIARTAIPRQFTSGQESSAKSQEDNHNFSTAEPENDISECTLVTDDIYPEPNSSNDFYKNITNFITEHILAQKIRQTRSLQSAMALFNQLNESDDFNSARFTVLLIDTISRMETEFVPRVMERLFFYLDCFKNDCERSVKCFSQHVLRYNTLLFLKNLTEYFSEKQIEDLRVEFQVLKTSLWVTYPDMPASERMSNFFFEEEQSSAILKERKLAQSIKSFQDLLNVTLLHTTNNGLLIMMYIRSVHRRKNFKKQFRQGKIRKRNEMTSLIHAILIGNPEDYSFATMSKKNKLQFNNAILIWIALESGKFSDAMLNKLVDAKLGKAWPGSHFLKCLLESTPETIMDKVTQLLQCAKTGTAVSIAYTLQESHAVAISYKLLGINKISIISQLAMTNAPIFSYLEAMLHWRHPGQLSDEATMDEISAVLVTSGREAIPEASCRLLDFILEQESRGKAVSDIIVCQCCRFLHARTFNATDEQTLYQGITLYLGKGCVSDKEKGLQCINQALTSDSPIPALRMARLQEQQLFPANVIEQDCLKLFAQKADTDQELYRDYKQVIFIELLLSLGESGLDWLIGRLKRVSDDDISVSRIAELLQEKLDIWRRNGTESSQQLSLPQKKNVAATVISKQPSQSVVKPKPQPIRGKRTQKRKEQEAGRRRDLFQIRPRFAVGPVQPVPIQQLLEQLMVKNKDKAVSEIPDEEITELLKLLEQLKRKTTTTIRDLSKNSLANLVRMLPWSATILGEVIATHLKNMTDPHARANYARQQLERYECLVSEQLTVTGDTETQPQGATAKAQAVTGKLLLQQPVPPGVQELIKNTTQVHQEALLSGNLSKDELSVAVWRYPDLYLHYLQEAKKPEINCVKNIWNVLDSTSQTVLLIKTGVILFTDQCGTDQDSAIKILNAEKLSNDARLSLFESLPEKSKEALLMLAKGIPGNLVRGYLERMKKTQPKQKTTQHQIRSINQWLTSSEKRLTDHLIHLLKELPSNATESDKMKFREFRKALKKDMDLKIEAIKVMGASLTTGLAKRFKASAILMELKEIAKAEAEQETLQPG